MFRTYIPSSAPWFERAMSYIQSEEMDRCEKWMRGLPPIHLFGACTDKDAETLWRISYDAQFYPMQPRLHTVKGLENHVLHDLSKEVYFLSVGEYTLLQRLLNQKGHMLVMSHGEMASVVSLVRRLWCSVTFHENGSIGVHMPEELLFRLSNELNRVVFARYAYQITEYMQTMDSILLWKGILPADIALNRLMSFSRYIRPTEDIAKRFLMACYDYTFDQERMILMHPGLIDPSPFFPGLAHYPDNVFDMNEDVDLAEWDTSTQISMTLAGLCSHAIRKDFDAQDTAADIMILAKHGAPLEGLVDALASDIVIQPTPEMIDCLRMIHAYVPVWPPFVRGGVN